MPRPIRATIDLGALRHNLARCRAAAAGRKLWAVVKANAYGHGIENAVRGFAAADGLALLDLAEAARARAAGWARPILLLEGIFAAQDAKLADELRLTCVVHEEAQVRWLAEARPAAPIDVYLKLNTGMNRLGFVGPDVARAALERLQSLPQVRIVALMTHFANADRRQPDADVASIDEQLRRFRAWTAGWTGATCLANSAALFVDGIGGDAVRPGIALYGGTPFTGRPAADLGLRPAMKLHAELLTVRDVAPGEALGYGARWRATRATRIGVVACGYADGYPRVAPDGTPVLVGGRRVPLVGRVSMDMITVDVSDVPDAQVGTPVELWGDAVPVDDVAERAGTVGYELLCALAPRVPVTVVD